MRDCFIKYLLFGVILLFLLLPQRSFGQEVWGFPDVHAWRSEDSSRIIRLVNRGIPLLISDPDRALGLFRKAEYQSRATGFQDGIGYALSFIGLVLTQEGHYEEGFACYREAFFYCRNTKHIAVALPCLYINMGVSYMNNGDYEQASLHYHKALEYLRNRFPEDKNIIVIYSNLAAVQSRLGHYHRALDYARRAEQLSARKNIVLGQVPALINMGNMYAVLKMDDSALYCFKKGLRIARAKGYTDMQQSLLTSMGDLNMERDRVREAITYYQQALKMSRSTNPLYGNIMPEYALGIAFFRDGEYQKAEMLLRSVVSKARQTGLMENIQVAHKTLADIYEATGRYKEALQQRHIYEQLKDSLTGIEKTRAIGEIEAKYKSDLKDRIIAENKLKLSSQQRIMEKNRLATAALLIFALLIVIIFIIIYRYRRKVEKRNEEVAQLKAVMRGEEMERNRIARELHDGIGGMLTGIKLNVLALAEKKDLQPVDLNGLAGRIMNIHEEIHKTARNFTPDILQQYNLWQAIVHYCEQFEADGKLYIDLQFMGDTEDLDKSLELTLYRIVQELIQNIVRHAHAEKVVVQLRREEQMLYLIVEDDGVGFDMKDTAQGLGLRHIRTRIAMLKGYYTMSSTPGKGTTVYIELDLKKVPGLAARV